MVARVMGSLALVESIILLLVSLVPLIYKENDSSYFLISCLISFTFSVVAIFIGRQAPTFIGKREGSVIVTFTWIVFALIGLLPFWLSGSIPSFTNAFFETISGFTTTGASILNNIESLSHGMLFWRSLTHWIGGIGIIVISLAVLPLFSISGTQLFAAETSGPTKDKIHPKINETAKRLMLIYVILTFTETLLLRFGGMGWFDSVCHSFATIATGGFSTKQASIAYWDSPYIQYVITIFMILSGVNFSLYYFGFKTKLEKIRENEELRYYLRVLFFFAIIVAFSLIDFSKTISWSHVERAWRDAFFTVSSLMTTTGFCTADYMLWKPMTWIILLVLMFTGASAGSTSGGIKMIRVVISGKACYYEFKRLIHPKAVIPVRYNGHLVQDDVLTRVLAFTLLYLVVAGFGMLVLAISGMGFLESVGGMITCLGGIGPGLGLVGPAGNFAAIPEFSKWFLSLMMLAGRLELFTVFLLFTPAFWKK
ncbi:MAG: potassium transporter [Porphyromonadaceae bacterium CG2_30_38_12]|nr:MAG: potassium transporter [Porphyromonadaceae bacterium CG2_30_38_12]